MHLQYITYLKIKVKWSRYRPGVAQKVGRGIAVLFHDRGTRRGWVVSRTPRPHFTPGKDPVPILQETGWAPGPVWKGEKSRPHRDSIPDRPARSQSLYRLSYRPTQYIRPSRHRFSGHLDTGFSWFPCAQKQMLRCFPRSQVATTCFSCSPPDLNLVVTNFMFGLNVK